MIGGDGVRLTQGERNVLRTLQSGPAELYRLRRLGLTDEQLLAALETLRDLGLILV